MTSGGQGRGGWSLTVRVYVALASMAALAAVAALILGGFRSG